MEPAEVRENIALIQSPSSLESEGAWQRLKPLGASVAPYFLEAYPRFKQAQARVSLLFYATKFARVSDEAFSLGLSACQDKASLVRYRACGLLAYSLRPEALPVLSDLCAHADQKTVEDALAAIDAIRSKNHHYFKDRHHTGHIFWQVNPSDRAA